MSNPLTTGSEHSQVFAALALTATIVSCLASVLMLWLIAKMNRWNGHLLLITTMTALQALYDVAFYSTVIDLHQFYLTVTSNLASGIGGVCSSLVSNVIATIAFYVIFRRKSFPIFKYYPYIMGIIACIALCNSLLYILCVSVDSLAYLSVASLDFYYYTRMVSIWYNFLVAGLTMFHTRSTRSGRPTTLAFERNINRLSLRLFYYPLVQAVSRSGSAWYEMKYGCTFSPDTGYNFNPEHTSNWAFASQCTMALSMPVASVGYLVIFLIMQPRAMETLKGIMGCPSPKTDLSEQLMSNVVEYSNTECPDRTQDDDDQTDDEWGRSSIATAPDL